MPKNKLFDDKDSEDEQVTFKVDNQYAKRYDNWREKEELHKLEQKYGDGVLDDKAASSSDSEDESDEPPEVSEEMETQFLKTLSLLKTKDPRIYDPDFKFFDETAVDKEKEEEVKDEGIKTKKEVKSLADAFAESDDDDDSGEIFKVEKKAPAPVKKEGKLREYLSGKSQKLGADDEEKVLEPLRALWSDPHINEGEAFLRDYILEKKYLEPDAAGVEDQQLDAEGLEADERTVEEQGHFERAYNFRFEEPDQEYLKRYPRTLNSIRPKDDRRSRKRAEIRDRKEEEKKRKMEEIARLKALKLKEIQEKIAKIKEVTGNEELAFEEADLEGDFDPAAHDRRMRELFDDQYYGHADDTSKPKFPELDEELEIENWERYEPGADAGEEQLPGAEAPHCEDEEFNMDADYDPKTHRTTLLQEIQETLGKKRRNRKKKSKLAKLLEVDKPKYVPTVTDKTFNDFMEEYYKIDCEDVIGGDLPTRFKYREVVPNSFGLTIEEILLADDKELNRWASLKKTVRHRPAAVERSEVTTYRLKAEDQQLKMKMLPSLFSQIPDEPEIVVPLEKVAKKKNNKKKKKKVNGDALFENTIDNDPNDTSNNIENATKKITDAIESDLGIDESSKEVNNQNVENKKESNNTEVTDDKLQPVPSNQQKNKKKRKKQLVNLSTNPQQDNKISEDKLNKEVPGANIHNVSKDKVQGAYKHKEKLKHDNKITEDKLNKEESKDKAPGAYKHIVLKGKVQGANKHNVSKDKVQRANKHKEKLKKLLENEKYKEKSKHEGPTKNGGFTMLSKKNKRKRKHGEPAEGPVQKKIKRKDNIDSDANPLVKLSDERLKAYGLNPKKYRGFLKYKKF